MQIFGKTRTIRINRAKRHILTAAITTTLFAASVELVGQDAAESPAGGCSGQQLVQRAAMELAHCSSLEVRFRQRATAFDQEVAGSGIYLHQRIGQNLRMRLELKLQVADRLTTILQVSDGRFLWLRREGQDDVSLGRVDLDELNAAWSAAGGASFSAMPINLLAGGGLPRLLDGLGENVSFDVPMAAQWESTPVWTLQGRWSPGLLARLFPSEREKILAGDLPDPARLPRHMPSAVRVVLRQPDLIPLRIDYRRPAHDDSNNGGNKERSLLVMEFYEVRRHATLDGGLFRYDPGEQPFEDLTYVYLERLRPEEAEEE